MSFPNYEGFPPGRQAEGGAVDDGQAQGAQGPIQPIESTGGQFPPQQMSPMGEMSGDSKTTLW
jgi:hypothetical protein